MTGWGRRLQLGPCRSHRRQMTRTRDDRRSTSQGGMVRWRRPDRATGRSVALRPLFPYVRRRPRPRIAAAPAPFVRHPPPAPLPVVPDPYQFQFPSDPLADGPLERLRAVARGLRPRAFAPYSGRPEAVALVLASGALVPGVRVESASFSLTIGATQNALTSAAALAPGDAPVLLVASAPLGAADRVLAAAFGLSTALADDVLGADGVDAASLLRDAFATVDETAPLGWMSCALAAPVPATPADGVALARAVSARAVVPESNFHVGCVALTGADGRDLLVPGCNVETAEWGQILCAERNAIGTIASYGLAAPSALWLACPGDGCSPCGACRQLLAERAPGADVWMHGAGDAIAAATPEALLPGAFTGASLVR